MYFDHTPPLSRPPFERKTPPRKFNEFKPNRCNFTDFHAFFLSNFLFPSLIYPVFIFFPQRPSPPPLPTIEFYTMYNSKIYTPVMFKSTASPGSNQYPCPSSLQKLSATNFRQTVSDLTVREMALSRSKIWHMT